MIIIIIIIIRRGSIKPPAITRCQLRSTLLARTSQREWTGCSLTLTLSTELNVNSCWTEQKVAPMRELLQVILPFNPSLFSALPQHKGPRKTPSITSFLTRKRTPLPLPSNPFVKKPHSEVVKSSITSALILNNGVRWVLNVGWSGYGSRLGEKKTTTDALCIRHQIKAQTSLSVLPLVHSSLPPPPPPFLPSPLAGNLARGSGLPKSKSTLAQILKHWHVLFMAGAWQ